MKLLTVADSSALFSLVISSDTNHTHAMRISNACMSEQGIVLVPADVYTEVINILGKKVGKDVAVKTGKALLDPDVFTIVETTEKVRFVAFDYFQHVPASVSFTDCVVMAVADMYETKSIFGYDGVFKKNGYIRLGIDDQK